MKFFGWLLVFVPRRNGMSISDVGFMYGCMVDKRYRKTRGSLLVTAICLLLLVSTLVMGTLELFYDSASERQTLKHNQWLARATVQMGRRILLQGHERCLDLGSSVGDGLRSMVGSEDTITLSGVLSKDAAVLGADLGPSDEVIVLGRELITASDPGINTWKELGEGTGGVVYIGDEVCFYQRYDSDSRQLLGVRRGIGGTTASAHRAGERVVRHNCQIAANVCSSSPKRSSSKICGKADEILYFKQLDSENKPAVWVVGSTRIEGSDIYGSSLRVDSVTDGSSVVHGPGRIFILDGKSATHTYSYTKTAYTHSSVTSEEYSEEVGGEVISSNGHVLSDVVEMPGLDANSLWNSLFTIPKTQLGSHAGYVDIDQHRRKNTFDRYLRNPSYSGPFDTKRGVVLRSSATAPLISYKGTSVDRSFGRIGSPFLLIMDGNTKLERFTMYGVLVVLGDCTLVNTRLYGLLVVTGDLVMQNGSKVYYDPEIIEGISNGNLGFVSN